MFVQIFSQGHNRLLPDAVVHSTIQKVFLQTPEGRNLQFGPPFFYPKFQIIPFTITPRSR